MCIMLLCDDVLFVCVQMKASAEANARAAAESECRAQSLESDLAAVTAELQKTKRMVPTPALLHQLAKATRSMQANHVAHQQQHPTVAVGKENTRPTASVSSPACVATDSPDPTPIVSPLAKRVL